MCKLGNEIPKISVTKSEVLISFQYLGVIRVNNLNF